MFNSNMKKEILKKKKWSKRYIEWLRNSLGTESRVADRCEY